MFKRIFNDFYVRISAKTVNISENDFIKMTKEIRSIINKYGAKQPEHNLRWWFEQLANEVLEEENYHSDGHCDYCTERNYSDTKSYLERKRLKEQG